MFQRSYSVIVILYQLLEVTVRVRVRVRVSVRARSSY